MAKRERENSEGAGAQDAGESLVLLYLIVSDPSTLDRLMTVLLDLGISGATVIESKGMAAIIREEMPIFSGLGTLLPERTGSRVVISATKQRRADQLFEVLGEEFGQRQRPIAFTVGIVSSTGLRG
ncbi:MAG: hypothetical protein ACYTF7_05020 [Planctomycetota bacterium]|jgi:hypothetical protein